MTNETKGMLYGFLGVVAFGLTLPATKIALNHLDPLFIGLGRSVFATFIAIPILLLFSKSIPSKKQFMSLIIVSLGVVIGFPLFSSLAMQYTPASHGAIILVLHQLRFDEYSES